MGIRSVLRRSFGRGNNPASPEIPEEEWVKVEDEEIRHDAGERWDKSDEVALRGFVVMGLSNQEIANRLGRSKQAISTRKYLLKKRGDL